MPDTSLRAAEKADVERLAELAKAAYERYVPRIGRPPRPMTDDYAQVLASGFEVTVAEREGEIVGMVVCGEDEEGFVVDNVAVDPAHQGTGVGRALLGHAEDRARALGHESIYLYTHDTMTENIALYERIGYVEYARRPAPVGARVFLRRPLR